MQKDKIGINLKVAGLRIAGNSGDAQSEPKIERESIEQRQKEDERGEQVNKFTQNLIKSSIIFWWSGVLGRWRKPRR